jgi:hypothetical protein
MVPVLVMDGTIIVYFGYIRVKAKDIGNIFVFCSLKGFGFEVGDIRE